MPQPSTTPDWNPTRLGAIVPPDATKKAQGWYPREYPPAEVFNWFWDLTSKWITYLKNLTGEALTWTVDQTFGRGINIGTQIIDTDVNADLARFLVTTLAGADATYKTRVFTLDVGTAKLRVYLDRGGNIELTYNAKWTNANRPDGWAKDSIGVVAFLWRFGLGGVVFAVKASSENSAWSNTLDSSSGWTTAQFKATGDGTGLNAPAVFLSALGTFASGNVINVLSKLSWAGSIASDLARLAFARHSTEPRTKLVSFTGGHSMHAYFASYEGLEIAFNAVWDPATDLWSADADTGGRATLAQISRAGVNVLTKSPAAGTWVHSAWGQGYPLMDFATGLLTLKGILASRDLSTSRSLLFGLDGNGYGVNVYRSDGEALELAFNAVWDPATATWSAQNDAAPASLYVFRRSIMAVHRRVATVGTWADDVTGWTAGYPVLQIDSEAKNPSASSSFTNTLTPKNFDKVQAFAQNSASGVTLVGGFNVTSVTRDTTDNTITVTFAGNMANTTYGWHIDPDSPNFLCKAHVVDRTTGSITFEIRKTTLSASNFLVDLDSPDGDDIYINVRVMGPQ